MPSRHFLNIPLSNKNYDIWLYNDSLLIILEGVHALKHRNLPQVCVSVYISNWSNKNKENKVELY